MWWFIGGVVLAGAALRWMSGRNLAERDVEQPDRVQRAFEALRRRPRVSIGSAKDGPVLLRGKVSARGERLTAPLSQQRCVFYDVRVDDLMAPLPSRRGEFDLRPMPSTAFLHRRDAQSFAVTDETGTALIMFDDVANVSFLVPAQLSLTGRELRAAKAIQVELLKLGVPPERRIAVTEAAIFDGDEVTVAGEGLHEVSPDGEPRGFRALPTRYVVRAGADSGLAILRKK